MQTNNAHEYTDEQLQAAIDAAFQTAPRGRPLEVTQSSSWWRHEHTARLAIARAFLAALPKPARRPLPDEARAEPGQAELNQEHYNNAMDELRLKRAQLAYKAKQLNEAHEALRVLVNLWVKWPGVSAAEMQSACKRAKFIINGGVSSAAPEKAQAEAKADLEHLEKVHLSDVQELEQCIQNLKKEIADCWARIVPHYPEQSFTGHLPDTITMLIGKAQDCRTPAQPTQPAKPWTPAPGDVVRLKSGGPEMTVSLIRFDNDIECRWFDVNGHNGFAFPAACLTPAKEARP